MSVSNFNTTVVADPGDAGTIAIGNYSLICGLDSGGAETRTLPDPSTVGQQAYFYAAWTAGLGGTIAVNAASAVDQTGNDTIGFNSDGDFVALIAVKRTGSLRWQIVGSDGVALS